jgi:hypothetical protein
MEMGQWVSVLLRVIHLGGLRLLLIDPVGMMMFMNLVLTALS